LWEPEDFYLQHNVNATVAWGKLYHRSTVLPYPKGKLHDDEYVTYQILFTLERIAIVEAGLYGYFQNDAGITKSTWTPKRMDAWMALEQQVAYFLEIGDTINASARVSAWGANVCRQMDSIKMDCSGADRTYYLSLCRVQLRYILKEYRTLMGHNLLDYKEMYIAAWPRRRIYVLGYCKIKVLFHHVIVSWLGPDRLEKLKERIGFR
jgi:hypothetical protein